VPSQPSHARASITAILRNDRNALRVINAAIESVMFFVADMD